MPWFLTSPLRGGRPVALRPVPPPSLVHSFQVYAFGRRGGAAPGAGCGLLLAGQPAGGGGGGGVAGGPSWAGGRSASVRPSAFPGRATKRASLAALKSWGAWPSGGGGTSLRPLGGWRDGAPMARRPEGGLGVRGEGGPVVPHPPALGRWPVAPGPVPFLLRQTPPGYIRSAGVTESSGRRARPWSAVGGSAWRGGGGAVSAPYPRGLARRAPRDGGRGGLFAAVCSPAYPGRALRRVVLSAPMPHTLPSPCRCGPRGALECWHRAAGRQWALRELVCGRVGALGARLRSPRLWRPPGRFGGGAGPPPPRPASGRPRAGGGGGREGRGGEGGLPAVCPWSPGVAPRSRGEAAWWFRSRGAVMCSAECQQIAVEY